jgi:HlyD family secretion protein
MNKRNLIIAASALTLVVFYFIFRDSGVIDEQDLLVNAKQGRFTVEIVTSGELEAKNSVKISGPSGLRQARLWNVNIENLVDEGTVVKKGQFVASLDKSELADRLKNKDNEYQQSLSQFTQTKLDTALTLRAARDELVNLKFAVEERQLELEQSQFEPPATIKQAEIALEKAKRNYEQALQNYKLKRDKAVAQMQEAGAKLNENRFELEFLQNLEKQFIILAPEDGMVIYQREFGGQKKTKGSSVGAWDPVVATLPDLSKMISITYVNEVDIRKVQRGQKVKIGLDAFPDKKLTGQVMSVANVGEQKPNSDAKVFEVKIEVFEEDTSLRPAMTTSNSIITDVVDDVVFVPLEAIHSQGDSITFVYKRQGLAVQKQQVVLGKANANEVIVLKGVEADDKVFVSIPRGMKDASVVMLEGADLKSLSKN